LKKTLLGDLWEERSFFTEHERAALAETEAGTSARDMYRMMLARGSFSENELVDLTLTVVVINGSKHLTLSFAPYLATTNLPSRIM